MRGLDPRIHLLSTEKVFTKIDGLPGQARQIGRMPNASDDEAQLPPRAQPGEQLGCRPPVGRQTELDLAVADGNAALEAEHAIDTADVIAALFQKLLQLAGLFEGDFRDVRAASVHGRRAVETRPV